MDKKKQLTNLSVYTYLEKDNYSLQDIAKELKISFSVTTLDPSRTEDTMEGPRQVLTSVFPEKQKPCCS